MQVFTTVGSAAKRKFLLETFPGLREDHIGDSRSESFEGLVRNMTRGKGVHLCLNSLSDEKLQVLLLTGNGYLSASLVYPGNLFLPAHCFSVKKETTSLSLP